MGNIETALLGLLNSAREIHSAHAAELNLWMCRLFCVWVGFLIS